MKNTLILFLLSNLLLLTACNLPLGKKLGLDKTFSKPFNKAESILLDQELREKIEENGINIKNVQFYNSKEIVLNYEIPSENIKVKDGKLAVNRKDFAQKVIIKAFTKGRCIDYDDETLTISFEKGPSKALIFGRDFAGLNSDAYILYAYDWEGGNGKVKYDYAVYSLEAEGANAQLYVQKTDILKVSHNKRYAPGEDWHGN